MNERIIDYTITAAQWTFGILLAAVCLVACGVTAYEDWKYPERRFEVTYIEIADGTKVKCMYDNSWGETFDCQWPTGDDSE